MSHRPTTVVYAGGGGRFGNQFLRFAHWLAWTMEKQDRIRFRNMAFWPYASLFRTWAQYPGCGYPLGRSFADNLVKMRRVLPACVLQRLDWRLQRGAVHLARFMPCMEVSSLDDQAGQKLILDASTFNGCARLVVCSGWRIMAWDAFERQERQVRSLMQPNEALESIAGRFMAPLRQQYDVLVGLFIRRGDYREWSAGRFYYPWESYARWSDELCALFPGRRVGVLLAGDEAIPPLLCKPGKCIHASGTVNLGGHWFESFLELSACDYIVSAPSTFAACAAFAGDRPLLPLRSPDQTLSLEEVMARHLFDAARDRDFSVAVM